MWRSRTRVGEPVLLTEAGCAYRIMFERALAAAGVYPTASLEFASVEAIKQFVKVGMGITILPSITVRREVAEGTLAPLHCPDPPFKVMSQMIWHKNKWLSPALRAFLYLSRQMLAAQSVTGMT